MGYCNLLYIFFLKTILLILYYQNFHFLCILGDLLSASCLWQIPGRCDGARDVINCSNILEAAKNLINCSLFLGVPQIFIAALYQVLIPLENCLKPKQFVFKRCSKYIGNTSLLREMKLQIQIQWQKMPTFLDKKCRWWGFGRFPYLWEISPLRMFWQPSHLSCTFLLKTFGANTYSSHFRCQIKILQDFFSYNLEPFMTRCQIWCTIEFHRDPISKVLSEW